MPAGSCRTKLVYMKTYNVHEAKTHLSKLLKAVEAGESFRIARNSEVVAVVEPYRAPKLDIEKLRGLFDFPDWFVDDFDKLYQDEIERMFYGDDLPPLETGKSAAAAE